MSVLNVDELFINSNLNIPSVTESQRDAMTKIIGMVIYNSTKGQFEVWTGDPDTDVDADYGPGWISSPGPELFDFTSATFTPGGKTGYTGPSLSQIRSGISGNTSWKNDANFLNVSGGVITWAIPKDGNYQITARGAQGGRSNGYGPAGGRGASMTATFSFSQGDTIKMVVGQRGTNNYYDCGGGGASYVATPANSPLIVAAGGGGASASGYPYGGNGYHGRHDTANGSLGYPGRPGGSNGGGGTGYGNAGGGGGFQGNGSGNWFGYAFTNGAEGRGNQAQGGFGGGGGGGGTNGAGGGGGYGGGGASRWSFFAAGGGSYSQGASQTGTTNANSNDGSITITYVG